MLVAAKSEKVQIELKIAEVDIVVEGIEDYFPVLWF